MMKRWLAVGLLPVLAAAMVTGCNLFGFTAPESAADFVVDGMDKLRDGDYAGAIEEFDKAIDEDPGNARARWGRAKAYLRSSGFTTIGLLAEVSSLESGNLPFMDHDNAAYRDSLNLLYGNMFHVLLDLRAIYNGTASNREFNRRTMGLDYTGALAVQSLLVLRDTNGDHAIDGNDIYLGALFDLQTGELSLENLDDWMNNMTEEDRQALVDLATTLLSQGAEVLLGVVNQILEDQGETGFDLSNLQDFIGQGDLADPATLTGLMGGLNGLPGLPGGGGGGLLTTTGPRDQR